MKQEQATVGTRVVTKFAFSGVPEGTEGVIDQDYDTGVMVAWDLPDRPLPPGYREYDGRPAIAPGAPLRDGFDKEGELDYLEVKEPFFDTLDRMDKILEEAQGPYVNDLSLRREKK